MNGPTFEELHRNVVEWARQRKILRYSTPEAQLLKTVEELGELAAAMNKSKRGELVDAYGDVLVTLIIGSHIAGVDLVNALECAWLEIKDRKGELNLAGVFVKEDADDAGVMC